MEGVCLYKLVKHHGDRYQTGCGYVIGKETAEPKTVCTVCNKKIKFENTKEHNCCNCGKRISHDITSEYDYYEELCRQADALGTESLTESQQAFILGKFCSVECMEESEER